MFGLKVLLFLSVFSCCYAVSGSRSSDVYIVPTESVSQCPGDQCYTLSQYIQDMALFTAKDLTLYFLGERHILNTFGFVVFSNVSFISLIGCDSVNASNGYVVMPRSASEIYCKNSSGFEFADVENVLIQNLVFSNCGSHSTVWNVSSATIFHLVMNLTIFNVVIQNSTGFGVFARNIYGIFVLQNSSFFFNGGGVQHPSGNVLISWASSQYGNSDFQLNRSQLIIQDSLFAHGCNLIATSDSFTSGVHLIFDHYSTNVSVSINNVRMINNQGGNLGFTIHPIVNQSYITTLSTHIENCHFQNGTGVQGGGLAILFKNAITDANILSSQTLYNFTISNTTFLSNRAEDGGGLYLVLNRTLINFYLTLAHVTFTNNTAISSDQTHGIGGGMLFLFLGCCHNTSIVLNGCIVNENKANVGGGLHVIYNGLMTDVFLLKALAALDFLLVDSSQFLRNKAYQYGGAAVIDFSKYTHPPEVLFRNSLLVGNVALIDASVLLFSTPLEFGQSHNHHLILENLNFVNNSVLHTISKSPAIVSVSSIHNLTVKSCSFINSKGSGIKAVLSKLYFDGNSTFINNNGIVGGALALYNSHLVLHPSTSIQFIGNHAMEVGGGIFVHQYGENSGQCFIKPFNATRDFEIGIDMSTVKLIFRDNSASIAGSVLYGDDIGVCDSIIRSTFDYKKLNLSTIATTPVKYCMCKHERPVCEDDAIFLTSFPGIPFNVSLVAFGENNRATPSFVNPKTSAKVEFDSKTIIRECTNITFTVFSREPNETIRLTPEFSFRYSPTLALSTLYLVISLLPCPRGFDLTTVLQPKCECAPPLTIDGVICNNDLTISRSGTVWIGYYNSTSLSNSPLESVVATANGPLVHPQCPLDYCKSGHIELNLTHPENLCAFNRSGILCGSCQENLSVIFGGSGCRKCSNDFIGLLLFFALAGFLLVIFLTALNLTVTEGSIIGVVMYANVVHLNRITFFKQEESNILTVFISWISLDFGIHSCFYDGMTVYAKTWLQFLFPIYICIIAIIMNVLSKRSSKIARLVHTHSNALKVQATLFLLAYMKILRTVTMVLGFVTITYPDRSSKLVWLFDGSVEYLEKRHIPLFLLSIFTVAAISLPYTIVLICYQCLLRISDSFLLSWINKVKPYLDAYFGPFKDNFRFWIGFLLIWYSVMVVIFVSTAGDPYVNLTAIAVTASLITIFRSIVAGVYKKHLLNILESILFINLIITSALILYLQHLNSTSTVNSISYTSVSFTFIVFLSILVYQAHRIYSPVRKCVNFIKQAVLLCCPKKIKLNTTEYHRLDQTVQFYSDYYQLVDSTSATSSHTNEPEVVTQDEPTSESDDCPAEWQPTKYPMPVFREDPILLSTAELSTQSSTSDLPQNVTVESLQLSFDEKGDALLLSYPVGDRLRLQNVSVDEDGATIVYIENGGRLESSPHHCNQSLYAQTALSPIPAKHPAPKQPVSDMKGALNSDSGSEIDQTTGQSEKKSTTSNRCSLSLYDNCLSITTSDEVFVPPKIHRLISEKQSSCQSSQKQKSLVLSGPMKHKKMSLLRSHHPKELNLNKQKQQHAAKAHASTVCSQSGCASSLYLLERVEKFKVTSVGGEYLSKSQDICLKVPAGAVSSADEVYIEIGIMLYGPFSFPAATKPISPIVWLCAKPNVALQKPIQICLPHILNGIKDGDSKRFGLAFLKAKHDEPVLLSSGKKRFVFTKLGDEDSVFESQKGVLQMKHFCFLCISAKYTPELFQRSSYCLSRVQPKQWDTETSIYFCVSYFLDTCLKAIDGQFTDDYKIDHQRFTFAPTDDSSECKLVLQLPENLPKGWVMFVERPASKQIAISDIDFSSIPEDDLELMNQRMMYPPRFQVKISGICGASRYVAEIFFKGCRESIGTNVLLQANNTVPQNPQSARRWPVSCSESSELSFFSASTESYQSGRTLTEDDCAKLNYHPEWPCLMNNVVSKIPTKWHQVGLQLKVGFERLESIEHENRILERRFAAVLQYWEQSNLLPFTWTTIINALLSPSVNECVLAERLRNDFIKKN